MRRNWRLKCFTFEISTKGKKIVLAFPILMCAKCHLFGGDKYCLYVFSYVFGRISFTSNLRFASDIWEKKYRHLCFHRSYILNRSWLCSCLRKTWHLWYISRITNNLIFKVVCILRFRIFHLPPSRMVSFHGRNSIKISAS